MSEKLIPEDLSHEVNKRISSIEGQLGSIQRMLEEGQDPEKILQQFRAAQKGLEEAEHRLIDEVYRKSLAIKIVEAAESCPGDCGYEERIQAIKEQFPKLDPEEITEKIKEIRRIAEQLEKGSDQDRGS